MSESESDLAEIAAETYTSSSIPSDDGTDSPPGTNIEARELPGRGPMNAFQHIREFPDADFKLVVRANFDTLYSSVWLDQTSEPMIVTAPDTAGRYDMLPMLDMWTDVFCTPGKRTSGTGAASWAVVPQGWTGTLPKGVERIDAPTPWVWNIGRTQTNGPSDYGAVHVVQDGCKLSRLSEWQQEPSPVTVEVDPSIDMVTPPLDQVNAMSGHEFFALAAELMKLHSPHVTDWPSVARMRRIGVVPGTSFDPVPLSEDALEAVQGAPQAGQAALGALLPTMANVTNGWQMNINSMGVYGDFYAKRAVVSMVGLGANQAEDAAYPLLMADEDGDKVVGENSYILHFEADAIPPAGAFWSVTMYDEQGFQAANELDRYAIGDRDPLKYGEDGSLDTYIQHENPGADMVAKRLPSPTGPTGITMRLYAPKAEVLAGTWAPPPLSKLA